MHEGGVPQDGHGLLLPGLAQGLVEAVGGPDGGPHAQAHLNGVERGARRQGIAADVPQHRHLVLGQGVEDAPVGTSGAHDGGTDGDGLVHLDKGPLLSLQDLGQQGLGVLPDEGEIVLPGDLQAHGPAVVLDDGLQLLHHHQLIDLGGEVPDQFFRQGVGHAQLQDAAALPHDLLHVLVGGGVGNDAQPGVPHLHPVQGGGLGVGLQLLRPGLHDGVPGPGVVRDHDVFGDVLLIGLPGDGPLPGLHHGLAVADPGAELHHHRGVVFLGEAVGLLCHLHRLSGVRRLQHGDLGGDGVVAAVLLVLGGVHPRVVGHHDDQPGVDAGVGHGIQRVRGHVDAHVLHDAGGPLPRQGGPVGGLHGHLLVGGPLTVDLRETGGLLRHLGARGAGVGGDQAAAGLI